MIRTALLIIALTTVTSCSTTKERVKITPEKEIVFVNFSHSQKVTLLKSLALLKTVKPTSLKIPKKVYNSRSDFKKLFGFKLTGPKLASWVTKRIKKITIYNTWTVSTSDQNSEITLGDSFFKLTPLEQIYTLVHEARHADNDAPEHINCPRRGYPFVSAGSPRIILNKKEACDNKLLGAYHYHASFLFECYAYGLIDQKQAGLLYNSSITRVLPLIKNSK